jgi:hypothetical protein
LLTNGTVTAWGADLFGVTDVPPGLTNAIAISAQTLHSLAVQRDGTVVAWGDDDEGESDVPAGLSNVMAIAAGEAHSVALKNDGTVVAWGNDSAGQTNTPALNQVKLIAAGGNHTLAGLFSTFVQYPVDVTKDLLLIYNTNSADSATVLNYYLGHRPLVSGANVLGIGCPGIYISNAPANLNFVGLTNVTDYETASPADFTNLVFNPLLNWLAANPTKRPQYVVLMLDVPSRMAYTVTNAANVPFYPYGNPFPSASYQLATSVPGWQPFITHINMNGTNDCIGYINKLQSIGSSYPGKLIISASAVGYGNTNYFFDDTRTGNGSPSPAEGSEAESGVLSVNPAASVTYSNGVDNGLASHITSGSNVAGYLCWGGHSSLAGDYANGDVQWSGNSGWFLIETVESYDGQRYEVPQGNYIKWFSSNAFGGTNYANTPIGAVTYVDEPGGLYVNNAAVYFGL